MAEPHAPMATAVTRAVAEAYFEAALAGADMRTLAGDLEPIREQLRGTVDLTGPWRSLTALLARRHPDPVLTRVTVGLRTAVRAAGLAELADRVDGLAGTDPAEAGRVWLEHLAQATADLDTALVVELGSWPARWTALDRELGDQARGAGRALDLNNYDLARRFLARLADDATIVTGVRATLLVMLGQIALFRTGDLPEVDRLVARATLLSPDKPALAQLRADRQVKRLDWVTGQDARLGLLDSAVHLQERAEELALQQHEDVGLTLARRAELRTRRGALRQQGGDAAGAAEDQRAAEGSYRDAMAAEPWNAGHVRSLAVHLLRSGTAPDDAGVTRMVELAAAMDPPDTADTDVAIAMTLLELSAPTSQARLRLERALALEPENLDAIGGMASLLQAEDDLDGAAQWLASAEHRVPGTFEIAQLRAWLAEGREDYAGAITLHEECLVRRPESEAAVRADLAWGWAKLGEQARAAEQALAACRALIDQDDRDGPAVVPATVRLLDAIDAGALPLDEALAALDLVGELRGDPFEADRRDRRGLLLQNAGRYAEAVTQFQEATRVDPGTALHWHRLGLALRSAGDLDAAEQAAQEGFTRDDDAATRDVALAAVANLRGNLAFAAGDYVASLPHYRRAALLAATDAVIQDNLARALELAAGSAPAQAALEEAIAALERAVALEAPNAEERLAWARRSLAVSRALPDLPVAASDFSRLRVGLAPDAVPVFVGDDQGLRAPVQAGLAGAELPYGLLRPGVRFFVDDTMASGQARVLVNGRVRAVVPAAEIQPVLDTIASVARTDPAQLIGVDEAVAIVRASGREDLMARLTDPDALRGLVRTLRAAARPGADLAGVLPEEAP